MKTTPVILAVVLLGVAVAGTVDGHKKQVRSGVRELVRIQGYREGHPIEVPVARTVELLVLGQQSRFQATEWRRFGSDDSTDALPKDVATRFTLQGDRATLRRFSKARPEQLVTILVEQRPGSLDLFVLSLDLCPPD